MDICVNGVGCQVDAVPTTKAIYVLRNDLGMKDVRMGCGEGHCGACVVLADGRPCTTCDITIEDLQGKRIRTVAGFGGAVTPHPVQSAFLAEQAGQCGYCLSGILASAVALYERAVSPSEDEIRAALDRHLCRCGTHHRILTAVRAALKRKRE